MSENCCHSNHNLHSNLTMKKMKKDYINTACIHGFVTFASFVMLFIRYILIFSTNKAKSIK